MFRPTMIIWRMLGSELWRLVALSATVLVLVIAFASAVRPLASGELGPATAIMFMLVATVPMLQFALPFAAGFAATLVYHRFASENEAVAASAGGVSHRSMLMPAFLTGLVLACVVLLLSTQIIPRFFRRMEALISRDAAALIVNTIQRGEAVDIRGMLVYADSVIALGPKGDAHERLVLEGVVAISLDESGDVKNDIVAERAEIWLLQDQTDAGDVTIVLMKAPRASAWVEEEGMYYDLSSVDLPPIIFPHGMSSKPKFLTNGELEHLRAHPDNNPSIIRRMNRLASLIAGSRALDEVRAAFENERRLIAGSSDGSRVVVRASGIESDGERWRLLPLEPGEPVEISWQPTEGEGSIRRQLASRAWITVKASKSARQTELTLELLDVVTLDVEQGRRAELSFVGLALKNDPAPGVYDLSSGGLIAAGRKIVGAGPGTVVAEKVGDASDELRHRLAQLDREITGSQHERLGLSVACLLMTLTGAVMAMRLRDGMPLTVYMWSFFPALATVVTIGGGETLAKDQLSAGLAVIWGGIGALGLYTLYEFAKLRRY